MEVQAANRKYIEQLKDWQAEAFVYVVLYCCAKPGNYAWNLSKVCALYDLVGDIFAWAFVENILIEALTPGHPTERIKQFRTNIRLLPKEAHAELYNICSIVLEKGGTPEDKNLHAILIEELS